MTARELAVELEVSVRSVYRDMADLIGQRVPIKGEAGLGYVLSSDFDMPPLMLTPDEVEAAVLGAQWVKERGDPALARAAADLLAKITAVLPNALQTCVAEPTTGALPRLKGIDDGIDLEQVRACIKRGAKILIRYRAESGSETERIIWPVVVGFTDEARLIAAWCEQRGSFRHFRADRITGATYLHDRHPFRPAQFRRRWDRHRDDSLASGKAEVAGPSHRL